MPGFNGDQMGRPEIVHFAKDILGCGCDNSVFNSIESKENFVLDCGIELKNRIVIGERLLIYIANAEDLKPEDLGKVIIEGITERNSMGYNRLRLAVVTPDAEKLSPAYLNGFGRLKEKDEKTHLHVVTDKDAAL